MAQQRGEQGEAQHLSEARTYSKAGTQNTGSPVFKGINTGFPMQARQSNRTRFLPKKTDCFPEETPASTTKASVKNASPANQKEKYTLKNKNGQYLAQQISQQMNNQNLKNKNHQMPSGKDHNYQDMIQCMLPQVNEKAKTKNPSIVTKNGANHSLPKTMTMRGQDFENPNTRS